MLVPATATWRGTTGQIIRPGEFKAYLKTLVFDEWTPQGVTIHNTAAPTGEQWDATIPGDDPVADAIRRAINLTKYYQGLGWQGGPHAFIADKLAIGFNPLTKRGTHSRCFNATHVGLEMVADFEKEPFNTGRGAKVRDLTVEITAALHMRFGWDPQNIKFHRDCTLDNHACPGKNVGKADFIRLVIAAMNSGDNHEHIVTAKIPNQDEEEGPTAADIASWFDVAKKSSLVEELQGVLDRMKLTPGPVDGWFGKKTLIALKALVAYADARVK